MASYQWNDGRLLTLNPGDTATCQGGLNSQQLYGLFFYNSAGNDNGATVLATWSQSQPPVQVNVPGTTGNLGLASLLFVSGTDTNTIAVALPQNQPGASVQCFIGSVKMPTNINHINNIPLPADGQLHPFKASTRFYTVPESHWYTAQIQSNINQFISVQFAEQRALVNVVNSLVDPSPNINYAGPTALTQVSLKTVPIQTLSWQLQGNGAQMVWINADSTQNSQSASISLQSLAGLYEAHKK